MSVPVVIVGEAQSVSASTCSVEHIHLHMKRTHWETKRHENLGAHLQDALDILDKEGWEVVSAFVIERTPEVILRRRA